MEGLGVGSGAVLLGRSLEDSMVGLQGAC